MKIAEEAKKAAEEAKKTVEEEASWAKYELLAAQERIGILEVFVAIEHNIAEMRQQKMPSSRGLRSLVRL
ncbi:hypothetical protein COCNU_04G005690 [Cocos nucifera]|uniref:Uncharacterized protein n=1 Tax=Cocos nucifera TaxID=13894 RepID=A0A8K0I6G7_COCNU|nr:hypothetical protein COCNU_04G005690 [Cocos nucifera]